MDYWSFPNNLGNVADWPWRSACWAACAPRPCERQKPRASVVVSVCWEAEMRVRGLGAHFRKALSTRGAPGIYGVRPAVRRDFARHVACPLRHQRVLARVHCQPQPFSLIGSAPWTRRWLPCLSLAQRFALGEVETTCCLRSAACERKRRARLIGHGGDRAQRDC